MYRVIFGSETCSAVSKTSTKRLAFADGLRGVAACWVVFFHMSEGGHVRELQELTPDFLYKIIFSMGDLGVPIFFVLSGYVMALTTKNIKFNFSTGWRFVVRRLVRLLPVYYFSIIFILIMAFAKEKVMGGGGLHVGSEELIGHAFLVQGLMGIKNIDPVFWTLCIEIQFYLVFSGLILLSDKDFWGGRGRFVLFFFSAIFALAWPVGLLDKSDFPGLFLPYWCFFMAGVWVGMARDGNIGAKTFSVGYAIVLGCIGFFVESEFVLAGFSTAFLLIIASYVKKDGVWLSGRWIQLLGLVSYSLYLIHNPVTGASFNVLRRIYPPGGVVFEVVSLLVVVFVCFFISFVVYKFVERPSISASRRVRLVNSGGNV